MRSETNAAEKTSQNRRKGRSKAKRGYHTGLPGIRSKEFLKAQQIAFEQLKENRPAILDGIDLPCTVTQQHILEVLLLPQAKFLTNGQIAEIVGCNPATVGEFRESARYYDCLKADVLTRRLERMEDKALRTIETSMDLLDVQAAKLVLQMTGRLAEHKQNVIVVADEDIKRQIGDVICRKLGAKQEANSGETTQVDAEFEVIEDAE